MKRAGVQAPHLQAGVQVAPGWQLHAVPHLQAAPQAQDIQLLSAATLVAVEFESRSFSVEFIGCSRGLVIGRERL